MFETTKVDWSHILENDTYVNTRRPVYSHHPSGAYEDCIRMTWYKMVGAPMTNPPDAKGKRIFRTGNSTEDDIQDHLLKKLDVISMNHKIQTHPHNLELPICGEIDLIFDEDGQAIPLEIKTTNSRNFYEGNYTRAPAQDQPFLRHCIQLTPYMKVLDADHGYILYECKDDHKQVVHRVEFSDEAWTKTLDKFKKIEKFVLNRVEPDRIDGAEMAFYKITEKKGQVRQVKPFNCRWCDFQTGCFGEEIIEQDSEPDKVEKAKMFREYIKTLVVQS